MTKTKAVFTHASLVAGQQVLKYYTRHAEGTGETAIPNSTDGYTLYRAIARQVIGQPARFLDIRDAVLQFYLRVYANKRHPLHDECLRQAAACKTQLFALLDSPDLDPNEQVLWVIAYAIKIRIDVFESVSTDGEPQGLLHSIGPQERPVCAVVRRINSRRTFDKTGLIGMPFRFESLLPDQSGRALLEYLVQQRASAVREPDNLQVKQMSWAWSSSPGKKPWTSFNEYRSESQEADLEYDDARDRMDAFVVTVNESKHIGPALELFREALRRAPYQCRWVRHSNNKEAGFMLPHCSVDAEFVKMERDRAEELSGYTRDAVHEGVLEELCSVLTFAVGRHFFLVFNIVHMLETSDKLTVPELAALFRETIFNKNLLKLWWNPQSDIAVLDATIAHMFQQTPRQSYVHCPYGTDNEIIIEPRWRIKRNHFQRLRPDDLKFPTEEVDCELHRWGGNEQGIACCCRLGNIDIAALFGHFCRMHGMGNRVPKLSWNEVRPRFRYGDLLESMLETDRLYPILNHMKDRAGKTGKSRDAFYQDMGKPGMELEDDVMAYNIGDVAGQNIIFEILVACDDKNFVVGCLSGYNGGIYFGSPDRRFPQRKSAFGKVGDIQLWEDNPPIFEDAEIEVPEYQVCWPMAELYSTDSLTPWEHDRRVQMMRAKPLIELRKDESHYSGAYVLPSETYRSVIDPQRDILQRMHDPTRMIVSKECVWAADVVYHDPIVRAGSTSSEALLEWLQAQADGLPGPPPGFGAAPGDEDGLPAWMQRVPGKGLEQARNIFDAFQQQGQEGGNHLGKPQDVPQTTGWLKENVPSSEALFKEAYSAHDYHQPGEPESDVWELAWSARYQADGQLTEEREKEAAEGLPYSLHLHDYFDLEGREYRR